NGAVFDLASESDGTLRVLGILTALYQTPALPLMGFEELEMMVHPKALATLAEVIVEASTRGQVIVTTHSPDLISQFDPRTLRLVKMGENGTEIAPISAWNIEAVNDELFSTGDLLRIRALES
ncbi:MAG: AAA family ATPase, partial [Phototrophicaceae bacterium]